ncbi:MAG TPA: biopolymer transporter ExbD [Polyangiaceae bacterium]|nr:biopolymer transporter ExbD [Polyangiaceae bacterium]
MAEAAKLSAAQRSKVRRLSQPKELSPDEEGGELNIVPFLDIVVNILIFVLATVAVTFTATVETTPPASPSGGVRAEHKKETLNLSVLITSEGHAIKTSSGNVAPGCKGAGPGIAIPRHGEEYDFNALNECAGSLKKASPEFGEETMVFMSANPGIDYQTLVSTIDAVRATPKGEPLFPDVNFQVAR